MSSTTGPNWRTTANLSNYALLTPLADNTDDLGTTPKRYRSVHAATGAFDALTTSTGAAYAPVVPPVDNTTDLGSASKRFKSITATTVKTDTLEDLKGDSIPVADIVTTSATSSDLGSFVLFSGTGANAIKSEALMGNRINVSYFSQPQYYSDGFGTIVGAGVTTEFPVQTSGVTGLLVTALTASGTTMVHAFGKFSLTLGAATTLTLRLKQGGVTKHTMTLAPATAVTGSLVDFDYKIHTFQGGGNSTSGFALIAIEGIAAPFHRAATWAPIDSTIDNTFTLTGQFSDTNGSFRAFTLGYDMKFTSNWGSLP